MSVSQTARRLEIRPSKRDGKLPYVTWEMDGRVWMVVWYEWDQETIVWRLSVRNTWERMHTIGGSKVDAYLAWRQLRARFPDRIWACMLEEAL